MADRLNYHLIGIGGVGMSAIAHVLHERGEVVSGSDRKENEITRRLRAAGMKISIGHSEANINGADVVVYTAAAPQDNPEIVEARRRGIPVLERAEMLGRLIEPYKHRVAVSGTHGKTTTTSMISSILDRARLDATVLIGADVQSMGGNARLGAGSIVVAEACEAFESFLHLWPSIAVITNIDADHMEYYGTIERIESSFRQFVGQIDEDGCVVACWDDERVRRVVDGCNRRIISYGLTGAPHVFADSVDVSTPHPTYTLVVDGAALGQVRVGVPGEQNVAASLAAAAVALELGADFEHISSALADFRGASRRFDVLYDRGGVMVVDDYAHHPAELRATLKGVRNAYPQRRIIAVFQPHLFSRTRIFLNEFADALCAADEVIVTSIYASREKPIDGVSGEQIVMKMKSSGFDNVRYEPDKGKLPAQLEQEITDGDLVLVMGAGDIRTVGESLAALLQDERTSA